MVVLLIAPTYCLVAAANPESSPSSAEFESKLDSACRLREQKKYEEALLEFDGLTKLCKQDWRPHFFKAHCLSKLNKASAALKELRVARRLAPQEADPQLLLASITSRNGNSKRAAVLYQNYLDNFPDSKYHFRATVSLAICLSKLGREEEACELGMKALDDESIDPKFLENLAFCFASMGRLDLEAATYKKYLTLFPNREGTENAIRRMLDAEREYPRLKSGNIPLFNREWAMELQKHFPITVFICSDGHTPEGLLKLSRKAFKEWQKVSSKAVVFKFVKNKNDADIVFEWTGKTKFSSVMTDAHTSFVNRSNGTSQAHILSSRGSQIPKLEFWQRSLHEIGHALGLEHTLEPLDIMCQSRPPNGRPKALSKHDISSLNTLYNPQLKNQAEQTNTGRSSETPLENESPKKMPEAIPARTDDSDRT